MAKTITLSYEGKEYTLAYTRRTISELEDKGLIASDIKDKPMKSLPLLFAGAFLAHHRLVKRDKIDAMFDCITNKEGFLEKLSEMYAEAYEAMMAEPEESEGNAKWVTSW